MSLQLAPNRGQSKALPVIGEGQFWLIAAGGDTIGFGTL
jgi:hypothetical protein